MRFSCIFTILLAILSLKASADIYEGSKVVTFDYDDNLPVVQTIKKIIHDSNGPTKYVMKDGTYHFEYEVSIILNTANGIKTGDEVLVRDGSSEKLITVGTIVSQSAAIDGYGFIDIDTRRTYSIRDILVKSFVVNLNVGGFSIDDTVHVSSLNGYGKVMKRLEDNEHYIVKSTDDGSQGTYHYTDMNYVFDDIQTNVDFRKVRTIKVGMEILRKDTEEKLKIYRISQDGTVVLSNGDVINFLKELNLGNIIL